MVKERREKKRIKNIVIVSMNVAIIAVSAWITVPFTVNFTLQTLAIFIICSIFEFTKSMLSVSIYLFIGMLGVPVFSGFGSGLSALIGPTGGYLLGFLLIPIIINIFPIKVSKSTSLRAIPMILSLIALYIFGTLWYYFWYSSGTESFWSVLCVCVIPFIIPDFIKISLAAIISSRLPSFD